MKIVLLIIISLFMCAVVGAQPNDDAGRISINAIVADNRIPEEAVRSLELKMRRALTQNGIADNGYTERFVLAAMVSVAQKDIVPANPPRVSQKMELTFLVGDVVENKIIDGYSRSLRGIGVTEAKSFITAFQRFNPDDNGLQEMLSNAKQKIVGYYSGNCDAIIANAGALAATGRFDEAIFRLMSVPDVCHDCYIQCQSAATFVYKDKLFHETASLLERAKAKWTANPDAIGAAQIAEILSRINPQATNYGEVVAFRNEVAEKLDADAKREWEFEMNRYEDNQAFKMSIVDACKAIGVAFGNGQPKSVTKTIIRGWF